jgi:hypothetical protein
MVKDHASSTRFASLDMTDPYLIVLVFVALMTITLILHILLKYLQADTTSMNPNQTLFAGQGEKGCRPKFKSDGKWHLTMNLRRPNRDGWLEVDDQYLLDHSIRSKLLDDKKAAVLQCQPGSDAACSEVLEVVVENLTTNFPEKYRAWPSLSAVEKVEIVATGEVFRVKAPFHGIEPLEVAARLAVEDFNILIKGPKDEHTL